jgi:hypothetical protein
MSAYAKTQFIAYALNTLPIPAVSNPPANPFYPGLPDPRADIAARCALIKRAIVTASQAPNLGGKDTLKIFMISEFALRGVTGAYDMDSVERAVDDLKTLVTDDQFADWVFVFGSVVGYSHSADNNDPLLEVYNFSLVQRGGANRTPADTYIVMKEFKSSIDFIKDETATPANPPDDFQINRKLPLVPPDMLLDKVVRYMDAGAVGMGRENQLANFDGRGIFDCAGIRFGIEICLDHLGQRIIGSPEIPGDLQVQVQLVPSCGMSLKNYALINNASAYAFNCDGAGMGASVSQPLGRAMPALPCVVIPVDASDVSTPPVSVTTLYAGGLPEYASAGQGVRVPGPGSEAGNVVAYNAVATPPALKVPGSATNLTWKEKGYQIDFGLFYDAKGAYAGASAKITNPDADLNSLAHMLPMSLAGTDSNGHHGKISFSVRRGGDDYDAGIECESTLPDFAMSGLVVEFDTKQGIKQPKTMW